MKLAFVTNAHAADQRSMIGYGELLMDAARQAGFQVVEIRPSSLIAGLSPKNRFESIRKLAINLDRFVVTPLRILGQKADIVHVVDPGNVIYLPLIRHRRSIVTVHDMIPYLARDGLISGFVPSMTGRWLMDRIISRLAKVDRVICDSQSTQLDVLKYTGIAKQRTRVIYCTTFQSMEPMEVTLCRDFRRRIGVPAEAPLVLHVGRNFYKNRETVLEVVSRVRQQHPELRLVLVGDVTTELLEMVGRLNLRDVVHVLPHVARRDMPILYSSASVLLFPSLYEGFGLPVLEAQLCGTPVVCSNRGSLPEVARRDVQQCDPGDVVGLSDAVLGALARGRIEVGNRDHLPSLGRFSRATWWKEHEHLYTELDE